MTEYIKNATEAMQFFSSSLFFLWQTLLNILNYVDIHYNLNPY